MLEKLAEEFATEAHKGQFRKIGNAPMITHPVRVAKKLKEAGFPPHVIAAAYLHDVVEDTPVTIQTIEELFGEDVAFVVAGNTEDKSKTWEERKNHTIQGIAKAPIEIRSLIVADKLDNLIAIAKDIEERGEEIWARFKRGRESQGWYFKGVAASCTTDLAEEEIPTFFYEYKELVGAVFG